MGFGKGGTGAILRESTTASLGVIAASTAVLVLSPINLTEDFRILKSEVHAVLNGGDAGEGEGLLFGQCNGELSVTEVTACLTANGPNDRNDRSLIELAERKVRIHGEYKFLGLTELHMQMYGPNGAPGVVIKDPWTYSDPEGWNWFIFNGSAAGVATGTNAGVTATHYGVWVT